VALPAHCPSKGRSCGVPAAFYRMPGTKLVCARERVIGGMMADPPYVPDGMAAKGNP
jgi:hypothetical protein